MYEGSSFLHILTTICVCHFDYSHPGGCDIESYCGYFFKYTLLIMLLQFSQFDPYFPSSLPVPLFPPAIPPTSFMSMSHAYKFFGFSIFYTIHNLPLSILYLPFMLLIPCTFYPIHPPPSLW